MWSNVFQQWSISAVLQAAAIRFGVGAASSGVGIMLLQIPEIGVVDAFDHHIALVDEWLSAGQLTVSEKVSADARVKYQGRC